MLSEFVSGIVLGLPEIQWTCERNCNYWHAWVNIVFLFDWYWLQFPHRYYFQTSKIYKI